MVIQGGVLYRVYVIMVIQEGVLYSLCYNGNTRGSFI